MKSLTVAFDANSKISAISDTALKFEQESALQIVATFPAMAGTKRAYLKTAKGSGDVYSQGDVLKPISVAGDEATLIIPSSFMVQGTLKIGFENVNGTEYTRFEPLKLKIDDFVNVSGEPQQFDYTVTITVGAVSTLDAGENATVENSGTAKDRVFNFGIPRGANVDIKKSATHIQWKPETSDTWIDLVPLTDLESDDVEFRNNGTHIQIRYYYPSTDTYSAWAALVPLTDLKGDTGDSGVYIGTTEPADANVWINPVGVPSIITRCATIKIAASNATAKSRSAADYVCDGTADDVEINAAIQALAVTGGSIELSEGTFNTSNFITVNKTNIWIRGQKHATVINAAKSFTVSGLKTVFSDLKITGVSDLIKGGGNNTASVMSILDCELVITADNGNNNRAVGCMGLGKFYIRGCNIQTLFPSTLTGVYVQYGELVMSSCNITGGMVGLSIALAAKVALTESIISNSYDFGIVNLGRLKISNSDINTIDNSAGILMMVTNTTIDDLNTTTSLSNIKPATVAVLQDLNEITKLTLV